ncbi:DUF6049 family protein [Microbacterium sp. G2-8]|uniref:DUF6049 family protein n=1 Tax=Microbacterium sp. G2-8 TaxID=2842454 RepID=UPI001C88FC62|nr:DUF6049 family protein [Microbacterium sp. G2-8]
MNESTASTVRPLRVGATLGAVGVLAACILGGFPSAAHAVPKPATVANADDATQDPVDDQRLLTLTSDDRGVVTGSELATSLRITNSTGEEFAESSVTFARGEALPDAGAVESWMSGAAETGAQELETLDTAAVPASTSLTVDVELSLGDIPPGAYPIVATYDGTGEPEEVRTVIVVTGGSAADVAMVVPITGPVSTRGLYADDTLATLTGEDGLLTAQLDAVDGTSAILAVDPAIPAAIRALGDTAPESATLWLERLLAMQNERFALQFADADVSSQIEAGLEAPMRPTHLGAYLDENMRAESEAPVTLSSLLSISNEPAPTVYWPAPGTADRDIVSALTADSDAHVLVPAWTTGDEAPQLGDDILAYDQDVSTALLDAASESDAVVRDEAYTTATAQIWLAAQETEQPLLLALDRMGSDRLTTDPNGQTVSDTELDLTADGLRDAVLTAMRNPAFTHTGLGDVLDASGGAVALRDLDPPQAAAAAVTAYLEDEPGIDHISKALVNPALFTGQVRAEALHQLQVSWRTNAEGWRDDAERFAELNDDRATAIDIQEPSPVQLISPEADMPVWIRNELPYPATLTIHADPDDPRLSIDETTEITAQADSTTRVTIPIAARVGSGEVTVHLRLEAKTGEQIGPARDMDVTVRAEWERIGIGIIVVLVLGLLGFGTVRQIRRRRRDRADADGTPDTTEEGA